MVSIEIDEEVWEKIKSKAILFEHHSPNDVMRYILGMPQLSSAYGVPAESNYNRRSSIPKQDLKQRNPESVGAVNPKLAGKLKRENYVRQLSQRGITLKYYDKIIYKSTGRQKVAIPTASPIEPDRWFLGMKSQYFERNFPMAIILLCTDNSGKELDFVLPHTIVTKIFPHLSRDGFDQVKFNVVRRSNDRYYLSLNGGDALEISDFLGKTGVLIA